jgi:hypothetical protein
VPGVVHIIVGGIVFLPWREHLPQDRLEIPRGDELAAKGVDRVLLGLQAEVFLDFPSHLSRLLPIDRRTGKL